MSRFTSSKNVADGAFMVMGIAAAVCVIGSIAGSRSRSSEPAPAQAPMQESIAPPPHSAFVPIRSIPVTPAPDASAAAPAASVASLPADPPTPSLASTAPPQPADGMPQSAAPDAVQQTPPDPKDAERESLRESIDAMEADLPAERALDEENRQWNEDNINELSQAAQAEQDDIDQLRNQGSTDEADQRQAQLNEAVIFVGGVDVLGARPTDNEEKEQQQIDAANARLDELNG